MGLQDFMQEAAGAASSSSPDSPAPDQADQRYGGGLHGFMQSAAASTELSPEQYAEQSARAGLSVGRPWEEQAAILKAKGINPESQRQLYQLSQARQKYQQDVPGGTLEQFARQSLPFGSLLDVRGDKSYAAARSKMQEGTATPEDLDKVARYERLQQVDQKMQEHTGTAIIQGLGAIPKIAGEAWAAGKVLSIAGKAAGIGQVGRAPLLSAKNATFLEAAGNHAGRMALLTPMMPSMYLDEARQRNIEAGRAPDAIEGFPGALLNGYANMLVLGSLQKEMGGATILGRAARKGAVGVAEQAGVDVAGGLADEIMPDIWKTKTRYGTLGSLARGDVSEAAHHAAVQFATFAAFAGLHDPGDPTPKMRAATDFINGEIEKGVKRGLNKDAAVEAAAKTVEEKMKADVKADEPYRGNNPEEVRDNAVADAKLRGLSEDSAQLAADRAEHYFEADKPRKFYEANWSREFAKARRRGMSEDSAAVHADKIVGPKPDPTQAVYEGDFTSKGPPEQLAPSPKQLPEGPRALEAARAAEAPSGPEIAPPGSNAEAKPAPEAPRGGQSPADVLRRIVNSTPGMKPEWADALFGRMNETSREAANAAGVSHQTVINHSEKAFETLKAARPDVFGKFESAEGFIDAVIQDRKAGARAARKADVMQSGISSKFQRRGMDRMNRNIEEIGRAAEEAINEAPGPSGYETFVKSVERKLGREMTPGEAEQLLGPLHGRLSDAVAKAKLSPEQRAAYEEAIADVTSKMPEAARSRATYHLKDATVHETSEAAWEGGTRQMVEDARTKADRDYWQSELDAGAGVEGGASVDANGNLHIDGGLYEQAFVGKYGGYIDAAGVWAHEHGHLIDGPPRNAKGEVDVHGKRELSDSEGWSEAYRKEIKSRDKVLFKLSEYASSSRSEGFAEFARLLYGTDVPTAKIATDFPIASRFFKDKGLWPAERGGKESAVEKMSEMFSERLGPTPNSADHVDVIATQLQRIRIPRLNDLKEMFNNREGKSLGEITRKWLSSAGDLPPKAFEEKLQHEGRVGEEAQKVANAVRDLEKVVGDWRSVPEDAIAHMNEALAGNPAAMAALKPEIADPIRRMRDHVDLISDQLIRSGAVQGPLAAIVEANKGVYLNRSYRVFSDPDWSAKLRATTEGQATINQFKSWMRMEAAKEGRHLSAEDLDGITEKLLKNDTAAENPIAFLTHSKLSSKDLGVLTARKDIPEPLRSLWGEAKDPVANYARSVGQAANLLSNHIFQTRVRDMGLREGFFSEKPTVDMPHEIAPQGSRGMDVLAGLHTTKEIKKAFEDVYKTENLPEYMKAYMKVLGLAKYGKTILSPIGHIRNTLGNTGFIMTGPDVATGFKEAKSRLSDMLADGKAGREYHLELIRRGLDDSVLGGEFRDIANDALGAKDPFTAMSAITENSLGRRIRRGFKAGEKAYRYEDLIAKVVGFEQEKSAYARAYPEWSAEQVAAKAAENVQMRFPTYSRVPRIMKAVRRFPIIGPFVSFSSEVVRTTYKTARLAATEMQDPRTREIGARRMAGMIASLSSFAALGAMTRQLAGITLDEEDSIRKFLPEWSRDSQLLHLGKDADGKYRVIDLGRTDPHSYLWEPFQAGISGIRSGRPLGDTIYDSLDSLAKPFVGEEIGTRAFLDLMRNKKEQGAGERQVYNPEDTFASKLGDVAGHLGKAFEPGVVDQILRTGQAASGIPDSKTGRVYSVGEEILADLSGQRISNVDPKEALGFAARAYDKRLQDAGRIFSSSNRQASPDEQRAAFATSEQQKREVFNEMLELIQAARLTGMDAGQISKTLRNAGLSPAEATQLLNGRYISKPMIPLKNRK